MSPRFKALQLAGERNRSVPTPQIDEPLTSAERFGMQVFTPQVMEKVFPAEIYQNVRQAMQGVGKLDPEYADQIAVAVKEWAMGHGATHYTHWFHPWTGSTAEKHDSFIDWNAPGGVIEKFNGSQLIQGEPDASSFPSGGLRTTYEARGYTGWDPTSPIFLWRGGDGITLCIPSVFFSWTGEVLDNKIPLLRSDEIVNRAVLRLLKLTGIQASQVYSTLGWEQEYFVIDRALRNLRPDLVQLGKTVYGADPAKGQELQDHYFGAVKDRVLSFMQDFETEALHLGIPVKTRHNEVAPAQHEVAAVYEKSSVAVDHNILLMELMRQTALKHGLACLLHEKPFANLNGSGKHNNWSLATDTGINLLDPGARPEEQMQFLILLTAVLDAIHEHADLLRASIGSAGNDYRLGGHEAPPAIISVYLGDALEEFITNIANKGAHRSAGKKEKYDLKLPILPPLSRDDTDRNRTSPFAFTGNKFEFRAVGSASSCAMPVTVLNLAVARSLDKIVDEITAALKSKRSPSKAALTKAALPVVQRHLKQSASIRFKGDNYDASWHREAKKRGLSNFANSVEAFKVLKAPKTVKLFEGVHSKAELEGRYDVAIDGYVCWMNIEAKLMVDIFREQILPTALAYQKQVADSIAATRAALGAKAAPRQRDTLKQLMQLIDAAIAEVDTLEEVRQKVDAATEAKRGKLAATTLRQQCAKAREAVDQLELWVDDREWPLPKYWELLHFV